MHTKNLNTHKEYCTNYISYIFYNINIVLDILIGLFYIIQALLTIILLQYIYFFNIHL